MTLAPPVSARSTCRPLHTVESDDDHRSSLRSRRLDTEIFTTNISYRDCPHPPAPRRSALARNRTARLSQPSRASSGPPPGLREPVFDWIRVGSPLPSNLADGGWLLPAASAPPDRLREPAEAARRSALHGHSRPGRAASSLSRAEPERSHSAHTGGRGRKEKQGSHAEEIEDIVVFCGAVGAGDSLLLLLGDSAESKGRFPVFLDCLSPATRSGPRLRADVSFQDKAKDGAV